MIPFTESVQCLLKFPQWLLKLQNSLLNLSTALHRLWIKIKGQLNVSSWSNSHRLNLGIDWVGYGVIRGESSRCYQTATSPDNSSQVKIIEECYSSCVSLLRDGHPASNRLVTELNAKIFYAKPLHKKGHEIPFRWICDRYFWYISTTLTFHRTNTPTMGRFSRSINLGNKTQ